MPCKSAGHTAAFALSGDGTLSGDDTLPCGDTLPGDDTLTCDDTLPCGDTLSGDDTLPGGDTLSGDDTLPGDVSLSGDDTPTSAGPIALNFTQTAWSRGFRRAWEPVYRGIYSLIILTYPERKNNLYPGKSRI